MAGVRVSGVCKRARTKFCSGNEMGQAINHSSSAAPLIFCLSPPFGGNPGIAGGRVDVPCPSLSAPPRSSGSRASAASCCDVRVRGSLANNELIRSMYDRYHADQPRSGNKACLKGRRALLTHRDTRTKKRTHLGPPISLSFATRGSTFGSFFLNKRARGPLLSCVVVVVMCCRFFRGRNGGRASSSKKQRFRKSKVRFWNTSYNVVWERESSCLSRCALWHYSYQQHRTEDREAIQQAVSSKKLP